MEPEASVHHARANSPALGPSAADRDHGAAGRRSDRSRLRRGLRSPSLFFPGSTAGATEAGKPTQVPSRPLLASHYPTSLQPQPPHPPDDPAPSGTRVPSGGGFVAEQESARWVWGRARGAARGKCVGRPLPEKLQKALLGFKAWNGRTP